MHQATWKETLGMREKEVQYPSTSISTSEEASHKVQIERGMMTGIPFKREDYLLESALEKEREKRRKVKKMPRGRAYLPYGLTKREKRSPTLRRKLSKCIKDAEKKSCPKSARKHGGKYNYKKCHYNPVAVCRARLER